MASDTKISVKYEFKTDVWQSYDGHEQRRCLRQDPRRTVSYDYTSMNALEAQWLRAQIRKRQSTFDFIPMWHDIAYLENDFYGGKTLYIDDDFMDGFQNCDAIEIFYHDDVMNHTGANVTKKIKSFFSNTINLKTRLDAKLLKSNAKIVPLIRCSTPETATFSYIYSNGSNVTISFEDIMYDTQLEIGTKYTYQYNFDFAGFNRYKLPANIGDKEVLMNEPQWVDDDSHTLSVSKNVVRLDNTSGIFKYDLRNSNSYDTHQTTFLLRSKRMINNMIKFFKHVKGRFKSFYCPTWVNDFEVAFDIKGKSNYINVELSEMSRYYLNNGRKKKIVVFTKDYKSYVADILSYSYDTINDKEYGRLVLATSFPVSLNKSNICMVSFLNLVRLDSDEMVLNYETNTIATVELSMKEVDDLL